MCALAKKKNKKFVVKDDGGGCRFTKTLKIEAQP